jgi:hypothetical protein
MGPAGPTGATGPAGPQGAPGEGIAGFAEVTADGFIFGAPYSQNVTPGPFGITKVGVGQYCFEASTLPFDSRHAQVTAIIYPGLNEPGLIAQVYAPGKEPSLAFYAPCGAAVDFPAFVSIWDSRTGEFVDHGFYITFFN